MDSHKIPSDIIFEILTRIRSLKTLDACKSVCKEWEQLIQESRFMPTYYERTKNVSGYFMQDNCYASMRQEGDRWRYTFSSRFLMIQGEEWLPSENVCVERGMNILASCNQGILFCVDKSGEVSDRYYVCKPTTRQYEPIPDSELHYDIAAVGIIAHMCNDESLQFVIVRLSYRWSSYSRYTCEMFNSKNWSWRQCEDLSIEPECMNFHHTMGVTVGNSIHWLTISDIVIVFSGANGTFDKYDMLPEEVWYNDFKQLLDYKGKIGLATLTFEDEVELWMIEDGSNKKNWVKKITISLENQLSEEADRYAYFHEVVFCKLLQNCSFNQVNIDQSYLKGDIFPFRSDMEPVDFHGPRACGAATQKSGCRSSTLSDYYVYSIFIFVFLAALMLSYFGLK